MSESDSAEDADERTGLMASLVETPISYNQGGKNEEKKEKELENGPSVMESIPTPRETEASPRHLEQLDSHFENPQHQERVSV